MNQYCLEIKNLDKSLGEHASICDLSLNISRGKKVALLGLNGAGKSSFIRLLVGESKTDSGKILYKTEGQNQTLELSPQDLLFKKSLGYQSDTMLAISEMTARQYLNLCGHIKGLNTKAAKKQIVLISSQWVIEKLLDQKMSLLSKGNLQKLAIAQAFIGDPQWLFFDEPCQSLDPLEQERFNRNIKNLKDHHLCLFSTHNVSHALEVADEILLFHRSMIAYRFDLQHKENRAQHDYLLVCKDTSTDICKFAASLDLTVNRVCGQLYQIRGAERKSLEALKVRLKDAKHMIEFCLPEQQAVMPLFRLLASGEIEFDQQTNISASRTIDISQ